MNERFMRANRNNNSDRIGFARPKIRQTRPTMHNATGQVGNASGPDGPPSGFLRGKVGAVLFGFSQGCALELDDKLSGNRKISLRAIQKHNFPKLLLITPPTRWRRAPNFDDLLVISLVSHKDQLDPRASNSVPINCSH